MRKCPSLGTKDTKDKPSSRPFLGAAPPSPRLGGGRGPASLHVADPRHFSFLVQKPFLFPAGPHPLSSLLLSPRCPHGPSPPTVTSPSGSLSVTCSLTVPACSSFLACLLPDRDLPSHSLFTLFICISLSPHHMSSVHLSQDIFRPLLFSRVEGSGRERKKGID